MRTCEKFIDQYRFDNSTAFILIYLDCIGKSFTYSLYQGAIEIKNYNVFLVELNKLISNHEIMKFENRIKIDKLDPLISTLKQLNNYVVEFVHPKTYVITNTN